MNAFAAVEQGKEYARPRSWLTEALTASEGLMFTGGAGVYATGLARARRDGAAGVGWAKLTCGGKVCIVH